MRAEQRWFWNGFAVTAAVIVMAAAIYWALKTERRATAPRTRPAPLVVVAAETLAAAFDENALAAESRYRGKQFAVAGRVARVGRAVDGSAFVVLEPGVQCLFPRHHEAPLASLQPGLPVTIGGTGGRRLLLLVTVSDCRLLERPSTQH